ncbi:hypothetical protein L7F22_054674 [Adiantum nelumboides]|nr:hypothetical protein [Adiantum nelumboides]
MGKKGSKENWDDGGKKGREKTMSLAHRQAAALAWYRHGRKGTNVLGSGKGKIQNPFPASHALPHQGNTRSSTSASDASPSSTDQNTQADMGETICTPSSHASCRDIAPQHHQANVLSPALQASRFKAEALALQSSSSGTPSLPLPHTTNPNKQQLINMNTGQSLALLSLLPHHQSQKCFNLLTKEHAGCSNSGDNDNNAARWDCGSSLYDSFELLCLSNQLGRCLTTVNATAMASSATSSSRLLKNLTSPAMQGPPLQPSYMPRSLYAMPQFMIPNYLVKKASKKRSSLIHPVFSMPIYANGSSPSSPLPALPLSPCPQGNRGTSVAEDESQKKAESSGFRRVFNSLLKTFQKKDDHKPKRSNLSEELEKLPTHRPQGIGRGPPLLQDMVANRGSPTCSFASSATATASKESPTSSATTAAAMASRKSNPFSAAAAAAAMASKRPSNSCVSPTLQNYYQQYHHFRNEGFRTTSIRPSKSVKWAQPGASN